MVSGPSIRKTGVNPALSTAKALLLAALCAAHPVAGVAAPVGERGKFPESGVRDLGEIRKTVPSQTLEKLTVAVRITRIEPNCVAAGKAFRVRGSGFGAVPGKRAIRIAGQVTQIRSWKDHLIVGTVPAVSPGQALTVELLGDGKQVLARGNTAACSVKVKSALVQVKRPVKPLPRLPAGNGQRPSPSIIANTQPPQTPALPDGKALLNDLKARQGVPQASAPGLPEGKRRHQPFFVKPKPFPGTAGVTPRVGPTDTTPGPGTGFSSSSRRSQGSALLDPRSGAARRWMAPPARVPVGSPPTAGEDSKSGFARKKRHAGARMSMSGAENGGTRSTTLAIVGSDILRINGGAGPTVAVPDGRTINVDWSGAQAFVEAVAPGEAITLYWLALGGDNRAIRDACNRSDPSVAGLPERPEEPGDGRFLPAVTGSAFTGLATDQTLYVKLCIRTSDGRTNGWRHESQMITLNLGASDLVLVPSPSDIAQVLGLVRAQAPDLIVRAIQLSRDPGGGAGQLLIRFADARGRAHFREYFDGQQAARRSAGQPASVEDIYPFRYDVYVDGVHKPEASGDSHLPPSGNKHEVTSRYWLPGDGRPHEVVVRVTPRFVDHNSDNNSLTEVLEGVPAQVRVRIDVGSRFEVLRDGDSGSDDPGELEELQLRLDVIGVANLVFEKLRTRDGRVNVNGSGVGREEIDIRRGDIVNAEFTRRTLTLTATVGDRVDVGIVGTEHDLPCTPFDSDYSMDCREIGLLSTIFPVPFGIFGTTCNATNTFHLRDAFGVSETRGWDGPELRPMDATVCFTSVR